MIREAKPDEAGMVSERLAAEIANAGSSIPAPPGGAIMMDIQQGQPWFIDDDDVRVIMHAHKAHGVILGNGNRVIFEGDVAYVDHVWAPSLRHEEALRFLANHLLARWGDLYGVYPRGNTIAVKADDALKPNSVGTRSSILLSEGAAKLNARAG